MVLDIYIYMFSGLDLSCPMVNFISFFFSASNPFSNHVLYSYVFSEPQPLFQLFTRAVSALHGYFVVILMLMRDVFYVYELYFLTLALHEARSGGVEEAWENKGCQKPEAAASDYYFFYLFFYFFFWFFRGVFLG